jgi:hypothetical protein
MDNVAKITQVAAHGSLLLRPRSIKYNARYSGKKNGAVTIRRYLVKPIDTATNPSVRTINNQKVAHSSLRLGPATVPLPGGQVLLIDVNVSARLAT